MLDHSIPRQDIVGLPGATSLASPVKVLILHQDEIFRSGLASLLRSLPPVKHVSVTESATSAGAAVADRSLDVLVLPASLDAATLQGLLKAAEDAETKVLLLLASIDRDSVQQASRLPAHGYLVESGLSALAVTQALESMARGEVAIPPLLAKELLSEVKNGNRSDGGPQFTPREQAALALLVEGMSNKQIARRLGISEHGAKRHVSNVLAKMNCPNRTVAAVVAVEKGLIESPLC